MTTKTYNPVLIETTKAVVDLQQYRFIGFNGNYCTSGAKALGVSDVSISKGECAPVAVFGILLVEAGGTVAVGDPIASDAEGRAIKAVDSAVINGYALDSAVLGDEIRIVRGI